ncbi:RnfABCDGE type electron transport complex subunit D [Chitinivibrio alkaliphilus]|uniref:Ion-translocating oxidoreductase complex subunit D n=1 Tax=Chitinivibrio alkaliphilus ACht1 TaxID=1313304 RepID=U7DAG8_9BACT|nr:RnfABCDGE type electron transport complex subunit D [Chitinivibrio alkaliphilus]ERP32127.1 electron transport complex, RnfABCDGE type, D subunit [Chitinivibrio alkaliphilus ACht1]
MNQKHHISSSPHIRDVRSVSTIMGDVLIALIPAIVASAYFFGARALFLLFFSVLCGGITEHFICTKLLRRTSTVSDKSAVITSVLLALSLPVSTPLWIIALGNIFAIAVVKWVFGGLGGNIMNPALAGRAFLVASYPALTTGSAYLSAGMGGRIPAPPSTIDAFTGATPLEASSSLSASHAFDALPSLFWGSVNGSLGEVSALALCIGGIYLIFRKIITVRIPFVFVGTVFFLTYGITPLQSNYEFFSPEVLYFSLYHVLAGSLLIGAFFMATDMVTSPITAKGQTVFAFGCGLLTFLIRQFGGYPEGVTYAILLMNGLTPLIDRYMKPRVYGYGGNHE